MENFLNELKLWNTTHNLISKNEIHNLEEHIMDSLSLVPIVEKTSTNLIVDAGSGGGFPIIPLALWAKDNHKNYRFIATDIVDKKIAFLKWCTAKFDLPLDVIKVDKNFYINEECILITRAFASVKDIVKWKNTHLACCKEIHMLKGHNVFEELDSAEISHYELIDSPRGFIVSIKDL